jgi:hypothetical protein
MEEEEDEEELPPPPLLFTRSAAFTVIVAGIPESQGSQNSPAVSYNPEAEELLVHSVIRYFRPKIIYWVKTRIPQPIMLLFFKCTRKFHAFKSRLFINRIPRGSGGGIDFQSV